jgi:class 3 adenylate cyclase
METEPARPTSAPSGVQPPEHHRGLVTLLFSDVVGSTALKPALVDRAGVALLQQHHELVRQVLRGFAGAEVIKPTGDSFQILTRGVLGSALQMLKGDDITGVGALSWVSHGRCILKGAEEPARDS